MKKKVDLLEHGNVGLVSARLSLKRHYPFPYFFSDKFFLMVLTHN